jgi:hypothetical protein
MKIGAPLLAGLVALGGYFAWKEYQQSVGYSKAENAQQARALVQAEIERDRYRAKADQLLADVERTSLEKDTLNAKFRAIKTKPPEVRYVETMVEKEVPCILDPERVDRINEFIWLHNAIPYHRDEGAGEAATESALPGPGPVACTQLYELAEEVIARLANTLITYRGLSEFVIGQYQRDVEAKKEDQE